MYEISYDPAKRNKTLRERGLRFEDPAEVFAGVTIDDPDRVAIMASCARSRSGFCADAQ